MIKLSNNIRELCGLRNNEIDHDLFTISEDKKEEDRDVCLSPLFQTPDSAKDTTKVIVDVYAQI